MSTIIILFTAGDPEALGQKLYQSLKNYAEKWGPSIMEDDNRSLVQWSERERATVFESDLETNFQLVKECCYAIFEESLHHMGKYEVPNLAVFEAGSCQQQTS